MRPTHPTALDIIYLSFKQIFQRMGFWIRPNFWMVVLSLAIITQPAAQAGLYQTLAAGLRDPAEARTQVRQVFKAGFFNHLGRSIGLAGLNLAVFLIILLSIVFWIGQKPRWLAALAIVGFYFLMMWWLCQPFLFPALVENPHLPVLGVIRAALRLVVVRPFFALAITLTNTVLSAVGLVLMGPVLLLVPALVGLISIQAYWLVIGEDIPDWMDLLEYEAKLERKSQEKEL